MVVVQWYIYSSSIIVVDVMQCIIEVVLVVAYMRVYNRGKLVDSLVGIQWW